MKYMKRLALLGVAVAFLAAGTGCATIISGGEQKINFRSDPSEASIKVLDNSGSVVFNSQTPAVAILKKGQGYFQSASYRVIVEKQGYKKQEILLQSSLNGGWYLLGNFFLGGLIGWLIVDPLTGAMWTLAPESVNAQLAKDVSFLQQREGLMIVLLQDVPMKVLPLLDPVAVVN